jgi:hypothetical protein
MQAIKFEELSAIVTQYIPPDLQAYCQVGSLRAGILILITPDPVWATQLRYMAPELRERLRTEAKLYQIITVQIKVRP